MRVKGDREVHVLSVDGSVPPATNMHAMEATGPFDMLQRIGQVRKPVC